MGKLPNKTEQELKEMAAEAAKRISIRSYYILGTNGEQITIHGENGTHGNSRDDWRDTTPEEAEIIFNIVYAALLSLNSYRNYPETFQGTLCTAEFAGQTFFKKFGFEVNCYDTIYCPLKHFIGEWETENSIS